MPTEEITRRQMLQTTGALAATCVVGCTGALSGTSDGGGGTGDSAGEPSPGDRPTGDAAAGPVRAFPGAEGLAALTRGAASYDGTRRVAIVRNLNDDGPGSFRQAVAGPGKEGTFVVFTVGGIINLQSVVGVESDHVTIAGQTSPGGICLAGNMLQIGSSGANRRHIIVRHLRSIAGSHGGASASDQEAFRIWSASDVMIDHCSFAWGGDETTSVTNYGGTPVERVTLSHCIFSQGLTDVAPEADHGYGMLINLSYATANSVELHNSYFCHHQARMPRMSGSGFINMVNCVTYDWLKMQNTALVVGRDAEVNFIGNYAKPGPNSEGTYTGPGRAGEMYASADLGGTPYPVLFMQNNFGVIRASDGDPEWCIVDYNNDRLLSTDWQSPSEFSAPGGVPITRRVLSAATAHDQTVALLSDVGATKPARDSHDAAMVSDFVNGTGSLRADASYPGDWPSYPTVAAPNDTNGDGIPDRFELDNGHAAGELDPLATAPSGYLWIEEYINSLA